MHDGEGRGCRRKNIDLWLSPPAQGSPSYINICQAMHLCLSMAVNRSLQCCYLRSGILRNLIQTALSASQPTAKLFVLSICALHAQSLSPTTEHPGVQADGAKALQVAPRRLAVPAHGELSGSHAQRAVRQSCGLEPPDPPCACIVRLQHLPASSGKPAAAGKGLAWTGSVCQMGRRQPGRY